MPYYGDSSYLQLLTFNAHDATTNTSITGEDPAHMGQNLHPASSGYFDYFTEFGGGGGGGPQHSEADIYHVGMTMDEVAEANRKKRNSGQPEETSPWWDFFRDTATLHRTDGTSTGSAFGTFSIYVIVIIVAIILLGVAATSLILPQAGNIKTLASLAK